MNKFDGDNAFLGQGWSFPPSFSPTKKQASLVSLDEDIRQSIHIILSTNPGERVMQPAFGCGLKSMVFETLNENVMTQIENMIEKSLLFFEPRIILEDIDLSTKLEVDTIDSIYDGVLHIGIHYIVRKTNTRSNMVYPFYFIEGSHVKF